MIGDILLALFLVAYVVVMIAEARRSIRGPS